MRTLSLLLLLSACKKGPPAPATPEPAWPVRIPIAAINDFHGGLYEAAVKGADNVGYGGLPWLVSAVRALRTEEPSLILLDGGDEFQGSWPVNASKGLGSVQAFELLGVDAAVVGNHEFDYGGLEGGHPLRGALEAAMKEADYPFLSANIAHADGTPWRPEGLQPWTVIERQGARIGVVGLTTTDTPTTTVPKHVQDLVFVDPVVAVRALLPELEAADLDATVLVGHLTGGCAPTAYARNDDPCTPDGEIGRLLTELPEGTFDVMVLGHAHTVLHHRVGRTFLLENRSGGHLLGRVDLVIGPDGVDVEQSAIHDPWAMAHPPVDPGCGGGAFPTGPLEVGGRTLTPDPEALALIARLEAEAGSLCDEIGCVARTLGRDRAGESELGNWMADAMLAAFPGADLAIQNSGGIRSDLPEGTLRRESLQRVMPFDNRTVLVELTGAQVRTMLRIGSSGAHGILQIAGGAYGADPKRTGGADLDGDGQVADWETDRLCEVTVGGAPLDDAKTYKVVTSDFLLAGGDHLGPAFAGAVALEQGPLLREALFGFAEQAGEACLGAAPLVDPSAPRIRLGPCR